MWKARACRKAAHPVMMLERLGALVKLGFKRGHRDGGKLAEQVCRGLRSIVGRGTAPCDSGQVTVSVNDG